MNLTLPPAVSHFLVKLGLWAGILLTAIVGHWSAPMTALLILMAADFASGMIRAYEQKKLSSAEAGKGIFRKFLMTGLLVVLGAQADIMLGTALWRDAVVLFYCASEGLSILENAVALGLPVPSVLKDALQQLNEKKYLEPKAQTKAK
jgi:toxin secretion/phage lysis holin